MPASPVRSGLEGVVAVATEIAEPDRDGGVLRYRGVDLEALVGAVPFDVVWGLLVDGATAPGLPRAEPAPPPAHTGNARVDLQAGLAALAPLWGLRSLLDTAPADARADAARVSAAGLALVARSARGPAAAPVPQAEVDAPATAAERFLVQWQGEADPGRSRALDAYWIAAAEHGMNASTFTARVVASTGADVAAALSAAVGALSGPLHGGAPERVLGMLDAVEAEGDAARWVAGALDRRERLMGFGHRVYRAEDPRARVLRATCRALGARRYEVAAALEAAALAGLATRSPDRVLATNLEFWAAVILDHAGVPGPLFTAMFACARMAGWSAHVLEQQRERRLIRPTAVYAGPPPRSLADV
jgi:citrate synthase